ncbi:DUF6492 family protein [Thioalkalivibrio sp.]|uniref:DUF6492 family protein n=1 Tax=Thioalkalivibrio sp. TaxID=2093813 RepID=UPI0035666A15
MSEDLCLLTPTWSGDRAHFELMRASLERSTLAATPHHVVVQTEDLELFRAFTGPAVRLVATRDVLPGDVESLRQRGRRWQRRLGRGATRLMGSVARYTGRPRWVAHTGWHVQQITKLAVAAASEIDTVVALDSDVVVTRHARPDDFLHPERIVCLEHWTPAAEVIGKVAKWNRQAHALFGQPFAADAAVDTYFDTPFVFHAPTLRKMLSWLERRYGRPWWEVLLAQPPRRWSEFGSYRMFLRAFPPSQGVDWQTNRYGRYIFDASDPAMVRVRFEELLRDPDSHYVTIHSQSSGRQLWGAAGYAPLILSLLEDSRASPASSDS